MENKPTERRRRPLVRLFKICTVLALVLAGIVALVPTALSTGVARDKLQRALTDALGTRVGIADHSIGWLSGFAMEGLSIANPSGFVEGELLSVQRVAGDLSFWPLLRGRVAFEGSVEGLDLAVVQRADGRTNLQALAGDVQPHRDKQRRSPDPHPGPAVPRAGGLDWLWLDLELRDSRVELVHEREGVLERLEDLQATVAKSYGSSDVRLSVQAALRRPGAEVPGRVDLDVDVDAGFTRPIDVRFDVSSLDLSRYRPLLNTILGPEQVSAFDGIVSGNGQAQIDARQRTVRTTGLLEVDRPRVGGALLSGMNVEAPRWSVRPNLTVELGSGGTVPLIAAEGLRVDLGFLQLSGMPADKAAAANAGRPSLGVDVALDLGALGGFGGPFSGLVGASGSVRGNAALAVVEGLFDGSASGDDLMGLVAAHFDAALERAELAGHVVAGLTGSFDVTGEDIALRVDATVAGGPAELALTTRSGADGWPATLDFAWREGDVRVEGVGLLRYALPLLAGLDDNGGLDVLGEVDGSLHLEGPLLATDDQSRLEWLDQWRGSGDVALRGGGFRPSGVFQPLGELLGHRAEWKFDTLRSEFRLADGVVETGLTQLDGGAAKLGLRGSTKLSGELDYEIDLSGAFAGHRDGEKILAALGGSLRAGAIRGTLDEPRLELPDIGNQLQELLRKSAGDLLQRELQKGLGELFKRGR